MHAAAVGDALTPDGFVSSHLTSLRMMDKGAPRVVFYYLRRDKTIRQQCIGEIAITPEGEEFFTMMCPRCFERGEPADSCQVMVRKSNRRWELDVRKQGTIVLLEDPEGKPFQVRICGTIWCDEILRCMNVGCTWAVKVEDSKVEEV